jgi:hypothetical protein
LVNLPRQIASYLDSLLGIKHAVVIPTDGGLTYRYKDAASEITGKNGPGLFPPQQAPGCYYVSVGETVIHAEYPF